MTPKRIEPCLLFQKLMNGIKGIVGMKFDDLICAATLPLAEKDQTA